MSKKTKKELKEECKKLFDKIVMIRAGGRDEVFGFIPASLVHHYIPRALCPLLKYDPDNGVALSGGIHNKHHNYFDPEIHATILEKRGFAWSGKLHNIKRNWERMRREGETDSYFTYKYYEDLVKKLKKQLNDYKNKPK